MLAIREYEESHALPAGYINYAIVQSAPSGAFHKIERGEMAMDKSFFDEFTRDLVRPSSWQSYHSRQRLPMPPPSPPAIDGEVLFWNMMRKSREFDVSTVLKKQLWQLVQCV